MKKQRTSPEGRAGNRSFLQLWHVVLNHENFRRTSSRAKAAVLMIASQYRGNNNGNLTATRKHFKEWNIPSPETQLLALDEAKHYGLIQITRPGNRRRPTLYAITWENIDSCGDKYSFSATAKPPGDWRAEKKPWQEPAWYTAAKKKRKRKKEAHG